jgi:hypothetical protein
MGARANGLGYASACLQDEWALFNNVAGLSSLEHESVFSSYDWQPSIPLGNRMAAGIGLPTKLGVAGVGFFRFGDNVYSEQIFSTGFANQFGLASLGVRVNYIQYSAEGFGRKGLVTVSLGGIAEITSKMKIGAHIINVNQPKLSSGETETLSTTLIAGVILTPTEKVSVAAEVEKVLEFQPTWKVAIEYAPLQKVAIRTGFNLHPSTAFFGAGFRRNKIRLDYALQYSVVTGTGHQASISCQF